MLNELMCMHLREKKLGIRRALMHVCMYICMYLRWSRTTHRMKPKYFRFHPRTPENNYHGIQGSGRYGNLLYLGYLIDNGIFSFRVTVEILAPNIYKKVYLFI